jgi:hypothetical protein
MLLHVPNNRRLQRSMVVGVTLALFLGGAVLAVGRDKVMYVSGTLSAIKQNTVGMFNTQPEAALEFNAGKKGSVAIPYAAVASLEFEEKERKVVVIGFGSPVSKRPFYYLTMTYRDPDGKEQRGVFELGKDVVRPMLKILEVRSGKAVLFQDAATCQRYTTPGECGGK